MESVDHPAHGTYSLADIRSWETTDRYELIRGEPFMLASPSSAHQRIVVALVAQLYDYLEDKSYEVFCAPYDVHLFEKEGDRPEDVDTIVQPDIVVVCDKVKSMTAAAREHRT